MDNSKKHARLFPMSLGDIKIINKSRKIEISMNNWKDCEWKLKDIDAEAHTTIKQAQKEAKKSPQQVCGIRVYS
jgi:hypothetical protein